ncbi:MAG TPA: GNAT family N-acetyltransferase [Nitriliruptorales bacterium]
MAELTTSEGLPAGELRDAWEELVEADPDATVFHTPDYLQIWVAQLGGRVLPRVRAVREGGQLIGVVPEELARVPTPTGPTRVLRFLGGTEVTDYQGPVARPEHRGAVVGAWMDALVEERDWDQIEAAGAAADAGWPALISEAAAERGLTAVDRVEDVCPRVSLAGGYEAYLDRLPGKQRHELGRKARKLARDAGEVRLVAVDPDRLQDGLDSFFALARDAEEDKARFFLDDRMRAYFGALADAFGGDGTFRLHELEVGGQVAAATVSLVHGREWGVYNSAFDQVLRALAPGMVLIGELLRVAADEGCEVLDLLRGDEPYKYRFGAEDRTLRRVTITRS